jgi:hypothetical protein
MIVNLFKSWGHPVVLITKRRVNMASVEELRSLLDKAQADKRTLEKEMADIQDRQQKRSREVEMHDARVAEHNEKAKEYKRVAEEALALDAEHDQLATQVNEAIKAFRDLTQRHVDTRAALVEKIDRQTSILKALKIRDKGNRKLDEIEGQANQRKRVVDELKPKILELKGPLKEKEARIIELNGLLPQSREEIERSEKDLMASKRALDEAEENIRQKLEVSTIVIGDLEKILAQAIAERDAAQEAERRAEEEAQAKRLAEEAAAKNEQSGEEKEYAPETKASYKQKQATNIHSKDKRGRPIRKDDKSGKFSQKMRDRLLSDGVTKGPHGENNTAKTPKVVVQKDVSVQEQWGELVEMGDCKVGARYDTKAYAASSASAGKQEGGVKGSAGFQSGITVLECDFPETTIEGPGGTSLIHKTTLKAKLANVEAHGSAGASGDLEKGTGKLSTDIDMHAAGAELQIESKVKACKPVSSDEQVCAETTVRGSGYLAGGGLSGGLSAQRGKEKGKKAKPKAVSVGMGFGLFGGKVDRSDVKLSVEKRENSSEKQQGASKVTPPG